MSSLLSRRALIAGTGGAWALAATGCTTGTAAENRISFLNWQDYIDPNLLADFTRKSGLKVGYETYESNDALDKRLSQAAVTRKGGRKATSFDLIVPSTNLFRRLRESGRLQELDGDVVTEALLGDLLPPFRRMAEDPGNRYSIPWANGTTGIGYDTTVFPKPPTWADFLDPKYQGKASLLKETREALAVGAFLNGTSVNSRDAADVKAAEDQVRKILQNATLNAETYLDDLAEGKTVLAQGFSTDVLQARKRNPKLAYVIPEQGGTRWVDLLCIPNEAPNAKGANEFIAFYLDPKVSAANASYNLVATGNEAARDFVPEEVLNDPAVYPPDAVANKLAFIEDLGEDEKLYDEAWQRLTEKS